MTQLLFLSSSILSFDIVIVRKFAHCRQRKIGFWSTFKSTWVVVGAEYFSHASHLFL